MTKKKILFFAHAVTFAHLTRSLRCIECLDLEKYQVFLASNANLKKYAELARVSFLEISCIDPVKFSKIVDQAEPIYDSKTFEQHIEEDLTLIDLVKPDVVFGDFRHSLSVSCRLKKIKYVNIANAYWSPNIKLNFPVPEAPIIRLIGETLYKKFLHYFTPFFTGLNFFRMASLIRKSTARAQLKFRDYRNIIIDGDVTMFCESSELVPLKFQNERQVFVGPLLWSADVARPAWWTDLKEKRKRILISLGSSGDISILPMILSTLSQLDIEIVVALSGKSIKLPNYKNVFVADFLPLKDVINTFSLVICNGGSPMTHMALTNSIPVIGIVCNNDQLLNMIHVEKRQAGIMLRHWNASEKLILKSVEKILNNERYYQSADEIKKEFAQYDLTKNINLILEKTLGPESLPQPKVDLDKIKQKKWDYVIVGTGMGGSTMGHKLAQAGFSVLFVEKGLMPNQSFKGQFAELFNGGDKNKIFSNAGRSTQTIVDRDGNNKRQIQPFIGSGVGGSSAIYGAVLQRFKESDFATWPISYRNFSNYYHEAERLFKIITPKHFSHPDLKMLNSYLITQSLNPYLLPLAVDSQMDCGPCQNYLCARGCKNDATKIGIAPAVKHFGACLLTNCEVLKIESKNQLVQAVQVRHNSEVFSIQAEHFVLAAGALFSPLLLLESKNEIFPNGLGNNSDLVGRFLMRHFVDLYALKIDNSPKNPKVKEIGFDDFYTIEGKTFGTVQSFGRLPPIQIILNSLQHDLPYARWFLPLARFFIEKLLSGRLVMASIIEDEPQINNRIRRESGEIFIDYKISKSDKKKIKFIREKLQTLFKPFSTLLIKSSEKNEMLAHACGTCRMGVDPQSSVVDVNNKVHGIQNLYVVDSSFFPTSGGTNPGLTIAANSLRVADYLINLNKNPKAQSTNFKSKDYEFKQPQ